MKLHLHCDAAHENHGTVIAGGRSHGCVNVDRVVPKSTSHTATIACVIVGVSPLLQSLNGRFRLVEAVGLQCSLQSFSDGYSNAPMS